MQRIKDSCKSFLVGLSRIMLQSNALTGLLFSIGISLNSPLLAAGAAIGAIAGSVTARLLKFDRGRIALGYYECNAALVGIAAVFFFRPSLSCGILLVACSVLSALILEFMIRRVSLPAYTTPFILATWIMLPLGRALDLAPSAEFLSPVWFADLPWGGFKGLGQVMFQNSAMSGLFFMVGILVYSRAKGLWGLAGSMFASAFALLVLHQPEEQVALGLFGYNASLTALALLERNVFLVLLGCVLTTLLMLLFGAVGIPALTAPFVIATWIVAAFKQKS